MCVCVCVSYTRTPDHPLTHPTSLPPSLSSTTTTTTPTHHHIVYSAMADIETCPSFETIVMQIDLCPLSKSAGFDRVQRFSFVVESSQLQDLGLGQLAVVTRVPLIEPHVEPPVLVTSPTACPAEFPIVMHKGRSGMRIVASELATGRVMWRVDFAYELNPVAFPVAAMASTWYHRRAPRHTEATDDAPPVATCTLDLQQVLAEPVEFIGHRKLEILNVPMCNVQPPQKGKGVISVQLRLQHVRNEATREPLSLFGGERIWALRSLGISAHESMFR